MSAQRIHTHQRGHEVGECVPEGLVLADVGEDGEREGCDGGVGVGDGEEADDLAEDVGVQEVPREHRGQHQQQLQAALTGVDACREKKVER